MKRHTFRATAVAAAAITACLTAAGTPASARPMRSDQQHSVGAQGPCDKLKPVASSHVPLCTHGPDRLQDVKGPGGGSPPPATAAPGGLCSDGGVSGRRIEVLYGVPQDRTNRFSSVLATMQSVLAQADANLDGSDADTSQHYRFLCQNGVDVTIRNVTLVPVGTDASFTYDDYVRSLQNQVSLGLGPVDYSNASRIYTTFVDQVTDVYPYGGQGSVYNDDRPDSSLNLNNTSSGAKYSMTAYFDAHVVGHEIGHNIGAVQLSAPHSSGAFHCHDENDLMCYSDGGSYFTGGGQLTFPCGSASDNLMDCGHDDYYSAATPSAGNYLATHWNTAGSSFLTPLTQSSSYTLSVAKTGTGAGTVTSSPAGITCGATCAATFPSGTSITLTAAAASSTSFSGWSGACTGSQPMCTVIMNSDKAATAAFTSTTGMRYQEMSAALDGWRPFTDASGGYRASKTSGNTAQFTFSGTTIKWLTRNGPAQGRAQVLIDGVNKGTFDTYAPSSQSSTVTFTGLSSAPHKIVIKALGTKNAAATAANVAVDGFTVGTATTQETSVKILYDKWKGVTNPSASGGTYRTDPTAGSTARFTFTGTRVDWVTTTGPGWGKAEVFIDGASKGVVDLYASAVRYQTTKSYSSLPSGSHTILVKVLGTKNASATATTVSVDGFIVR
jgi:Divergent InlB B-repeat domain